MRAVNVPYEDLYVYLMDGRVNEEEEARMGESFLGNWVEEGNSFLFFTQPAHEEILLLLRARPDLNVLDNFHFTYEQWQGGGPDILRVDKFMIVPPWLDNEDCRQGIKILLDPGVVFGNGFHPTTRDCLRAIALSKEQRPFKRVLDLGTGTGLLALAAGFLGAERVLGVDLNPLCVETASKNVRLNRLEEIIEIVRGEAEELCTEPADLVAANIHFPVIRTFVEKREFIKNDRIILSGLMRSHARDAEDLLAEKNLCLMKKWDKDMTWYTLLAEKS